MAKKIYPHIDQIQDRAVQDTLRLLWDKVLEAEAAVIAERDELATLASVVSG